MQPNTRSEYFDSCNVTVLKKNATTPDVELVHKQENYGTNKKRGKRRKLFEQDGPSVAEVISESLIKEYGNKNE